MPTPERPVRPESLTQQRLGLLEATKVIEKECEVHAGARDLGQGALGRVLPSQGAPERQGLAVQLLCLAGFPLLEKACQTDAGVGGLGQEVPGRLPPG
mgnify:CR=1 FL=1